MPTYTSTYTNPATAYTETYAPTEDSRLLKEDAFCLLLESGGKILISRGTVYTPTYTAN
jgi:hypothetical protein